GLGAGVAERYMREGEMATKRKKRVQDLPVLHPDAAGIDVGASEIFVAVPADRDAEPVRSFATFTRDLNSLADWLRACGIRSAAMESTSVYWIPLHQILEARGIEVCLVNAQQSRMCRGEKPMFPIASGFSISTPSAYCGPASGH